MELKDTYKELIDSMENEKKEAEKKAQDEEFIQSIQDSRAQEFSKKLNDIFWELERSIDRDYMKHNIIAFRDVHNIAHDLIIKTVRERYTGDVLMRSSLRAEYIG